jgi:hypothetical protein
MVSFSDIGFTGSWFFRACSVKRCTLDFSYGFQKDHWSNTVKLLNLFSPFNLFRLITIKYRLDHQILLLIVICITVVTKKNKAPRPGGAKKMKSYAFYE